MPWPGEHSMITIRVPLRTNFLRENSPMILLRQ